MDCSSVMVGRNAFLVLLLIGHISSGHAQKEFVAVFMENFSPEAGAHMDLYLTTYDKAAVVNVSVSNPHFYQTLHIERNSTLPVTLDTQYMLAGNQLSSKVITVKSDVDISVFAFNSLNYTTDAGLVLPIEDLGTEYYIFTPGPGSYNQFAVANGADNTIAVNVTFSGSLEFSGQSFHPGDTYSFSLQGHQVIQFQTFSELTGTRVVSSEPVAVFSGNKCHYGPTTKCDVIFEQLEPVKNWGTSFVLFPLANNTKDIIDIIAASPDTEVHVNQTLYRLQPGSHLSFALEKSDLVTTSKPVMVSYLFQDRAYPGEYDPFLIIVPPFQLNRKYYKFVTEAFYDNYITIVSTASSASEFYLDHKPLDQYKFTTKVISGFRSWEVFLGRVGGQHEIYHRFSAFIIYIYGLEIRVSYGYSMGQETKYPEEPVGPSVLNCLPHGGEFLLPLSLVTDAKLNVSDVHLEDPTCQGTQKGNVVVINVPFNRCGSKVLNENGKTVYVNTVYGTVPATEVHRIEIPLKCEMANNETLGWSFLPQVTDVVSQGHYIISLKLYQTEAFTDPITMFPYEVDLHGWLYVEFEVQSDDEGLQILVESCKASPSLGNTDKSYNVIQEGCPVDSTLQLYKVSNPRLQRFSLHVFKFSDFGEVYLSCNIIICHNGTTPNRCTQGCLPRRYRRDVFSSKLQLGSASLSQGPIVFKYGERLQNDQTLHTVPSSMLVAVILVMGLLSVIALVIQKHYYKREYNDLENRR
ncbi:uncharacterized protein [Pyxicephalus adspersus]|uniref:uncharacterized protein isoform X2 n=1 Tax=Pyxicephalus adspersus TaxID=30357 RepID=UPI003B5A8BEB